MRKSLLLLTSALLLLSLCGFSPAAAETLRPSSKHPAPADNSPSEDELKALAELKAELEAKLKKQAEEKAAAEARKKKEAEEKAAAAAREKKEAEEKAAAEAQEKKEAPADQPPPPPGQTAGSDQQPQPPSDQAPGKGQPPSPDQAKPDRKDRAEADPKAPEKPEPKDQQTADKPAKPSGMGDMAASDEPIKITSNRLEADDKAMTVNFIGQVKAVQGETRLWCDKMVVHYTKEDEKAGQDVGMGARKIRKIEVFGHVKVSKGDKVGTGQQGLFEFQERRVVLWGKAQLKQGKNTINGDKVILYLNDDRAVVEGGPKKVEAVLVPVKEPPKNKPGKPGKPGGQG